jgi:hypothetical protein
MWKMDLHAFWCCSSAVSGTWQWLWLVARAGSGRRAVRAGTQAAVARKLFLKSYIRGENCGFEENFLICRGKIHLDLD